METLCSTVIVGILVGAAIVGHLAYASDKASRKHKPKQHKEMTKVQEKKLKNFYKGLRKLRI